MKNSKPIPEFYVDDTASKSPKEYWTNPNQAKERDILSLIKLIENNSSEKTIDIFIRDHPEVLTLLMEKFGCGHHHSWVIPQVVLKSKFLKSDKGLIPDYLMGGQGSGGKRWFLVELKSPNTKVFSQRRNKIFFSPAMNEGIHQLLEYLEYSDKHQSRFRDEFNLRNFGIPTAILIAGRRKEFESNERKKAIRKAWDLALGKRLEIHTYDTFIDTLSSQLRAFRLDKKRSKTEIFNPLSTFVKTKRKK